MIELYLEMIRDFTVLAFVFDIVGGDQSLIFGRGFGCGLTRVFGNGLGCGLAWGHFRNEVGVKFKRIQTREDDTRCLLRRRT